MPPTASPASENNRPLQTSLFAPVNGADSPLSDAAGHTLGDSSTAQARKLKLRKARFRGAAVPARNFTPPANTGDSGDFAYDADALEDVDSPPVAARAKVDKTARLPSDERDVLQEISNSSMRRKRRNGERDRSSLFRQARTDGVTSTDSNAAVHQAADHDLPASAPRAAEASLAQSDPKPPGQAENKLSRRARGKNGRSARSRQSADQHETAQYIEHLEFQLSAMETQINSLGSPSSITSQSAKLKALNSEAKMLRQEVSDWEEKFHKRLQEQVEEHEITVRGMRAQIKSLQKSAESTDAKIKEAEAEAETMRKQVESTDRLNQELERRVEFMSELLATSPTKLGFEDASWADGASRRSPARPTSRILPVSSASRLSISHSRTAGSPNRNSRSGSPTSFRRSETEEQNPFDCLVQPLPGRAPSADLDSEASEQTLINDGSISPNYRRWTAQCFQSDGETKAKPARRMRRFYTGSMGPRALILPSTAQAGAFAASAPVTATPTPTAVEQPLEEQVSRSPLAQRNHSTPPRPRTLPSDFIANEQLAAKLIFSDDISIPTKPLQAPTSSPAKTPTHSPSEAVTGANSSVHSSTSRPSTASVQGENLFQELTRVQLDSDSPDASDAKSPLFSELKDSPDIPLALNSSIHGNEQPYDPGGVSFGGHEQQDARPNLAEMPFPLKILGRLTAAATKSLDQRAPRIKFLLANAWSMLALSRPVLEFRWWLVRLLLGGLRKRKPMPLLLRGDGEGLACDSSPSLPLRMTSRSSETQTLSLAQRRGHARQSRTGGGDESKGAVWDIFETREQYKHATPPPVSWLKFSITLVFAVGIAIKDGPAALFRARGGGSGPHQPRSYQGSRVSDCGGLDSDDDGDDD